MNLVIAWTAFVSVWASVPVDRVLPLKHIYIPNGFSSGENAEIVASGYFSSFCYQDLKADISKVGRVIDVKLTALEYEETNPFCPLGKVPFLRSIGLGNLAAGDYSLVVNRGSPTEKRGEMSIVDKGSVNGSFYAGVEYIEKTGVRREIHLKGFNESDCFELDRIDVVDNGEDTYSVFPRLKQVSDFCPMKMTYFDYHVGIPKDFLGKKLLIYVKSNDGRSLNLLINN